MTRYVLTPSHTYGHDLLRRLLPAILALVLPPFARMLPRVMGGLSKTIVGSQHHGSVGLGLLLEELTRCSLLSYFAQPHKPIYALIRLYVTPTFLRNPRDADRAPTSSACQCRNGHDRPAGSPSRAGRSCAFRRTECVPPNRSHPPWDRADRRTACPIAAHASGRHCGRGRS